MARKYFGRFKDRRNYSTRNNSQTNNQTLSLLFSSDKN